MEEELRSQQAKYEEAEADVERRMFDIKDSELDSISDLTAFLDAQLAYHDRCRDALLELKNDWPGRAAPHHSQSQAPQVKPITTRSRSNTARSYRSVHSQSEEPPIPEIRPSIKSGRTASSRYPDPPLADVEESRPARPGFGRSTTYQSTTSTRSDLSPVPTNRLSRVPSDSLMIQSTRSNLRRVDTMPSEDVFADESPTSYGTQRSISPSTPQSSGSQTPFGAGRRPPPPPPPSRASKPGLGKPAPPPPPTKRTLIA